MYEHKEHINYSAADIRRYLNGEMNRDEMYALEKQAAEDPFLADAIEGYTGITLEAAESDLAVLRARLNKADDGHTAKVIPMKAPGGFKWWKQAIAAAVAVLVIATAALFLKGGKKDEVAANLPDEKKENTTTNVAPPTTGSNTEQVIESPTKSSEPAKRPANTVFVSPDSVNYYMGRKTNGADATLERKTDAIAPGETRYYQDKNLHAVADSAKASNFGTYDLKPVAEEAKKEAPVIVSRPAAPGAPAAGNTQQANTQLPDVYTGAGNNRAENVAVNDRRRAAEYKYQEKSVPPAAKRAAKQQDDEDMAGQRSRDFNNNITRSYAFNYRVTDNNGNSIPFSNISIPADQLVTYSRSDGSFGLFSADSVLQVNVKAAGYEPKTFLLRNNAQIASLTLNEESLAKDKNLVIVGDQKNFALRKQNKAKAESEKEEAEPLDGWNSYDSYLANNIDLSDKAKGEVQLSIEIDKKGQVKNVTVEKSLGAKEDQEAIRLITQGPKWKGKKKKSKGRVVVTF